MKTLLIYSTVDGQTLSICERIRNCCQAAGEQVSLVSLDKVGELSLDDFDKVLVGASIRYGKHRPELLAFVNEHCERLAAKINAFFTVNVVARKPLKNTPDTNPYMKKFLLQSKWQPQQLEVFAGKISYPSYGFFDKQMIRFIMWLTKGPTDVTGTFDFTDWEQVQRFGEAFAARS
ncbi:menaquinone-dependent protoporphyrinogen IX dehydrogenase [Shewanella cyperi]|uniref:menaquinone-dependent protoporphyrinogen IX dehydrogenase n=1 Tax=Shewanella cyperi TaxID=2814292 RepID=UPI001A95422F|nr:menaquinone-dependent protoporphyrinogen IX dehydrogenase [Shewanella cyperi]QSX40903.1 menaquinone-dependent protoporphyrinogen IX dehydrogenase [Shewanella cyperi]